MMITKVLFSLAVGLTFTNAASLTDDTLTCYNCGYLQLTNGTRVPLKEEYGDIPFCDDFASDEGMTVPAMIVSLKLKNPLYLKINFEINSKRYVNTSL